MCVTSHYIKKFNFKLIFIKVVMFLISRKTSCASRLVSYTYQPWYINIYFERRPIVIPLLLLYQNTGTHQTSLLGITNVYLCTAAFFTSRSTASKGVAVRNCNQVWLWGGGFLAKLSPLNKFRTSLNRVCVFVPPFLWDGLYTAV